MTGRRYLVSGRVQGVFFRGSCQSYARKLGVTGWARNRVEGTVEVHAQGAPEDLAKLESWLEVGPQWAKVTNIETCEEHCDENYSDFEIHATS